MGKTFVTLCSVIFLVISVHPLESSAAGKTFFVTVAAGPLDRRETVVTFTLPEELKGKSYGLRDASGSVIRLQVDAKRQATFVLPELKAGATKKYRLEELRASAKPAADGVQLVRQGNKLKLTTANRPVLVYQAQADELPSPEIKPVFRRGGYIHPVYTPSGRLVTDDYPADHYHHHGIWYAWTKTEFEGRHPDFWNVGDGTGLVEFVAVDETWDGPVHAGFTARHRYVDVSAPKPTTALNERWEVVVYRVGQAKRPYSMFDLITTDECAGSSPLILSEYRYGGMGFRGHRQWLEKDNCFFLTSEGKDRATGHATRARWCHIGGRIDGQLAGVAILDHPGNFRAPQPMRINPDQPFFNYAPSQMGEFRIEPGKPYVSRYRFIIYDGPPDKDELDRLWNDYASPPRVTVTSE
jgi:hypothetical protein